MTAHKPPVWSPPGRYGQAAAIDGMGTVAAPFLAGIAMALAVLVISSSEDFGAEGLALFALVGAAIALVASAECTFVARKYVVTPSQLEEWWPEKDDDPYRSERLERDQADAKEGFQRWSWWARQAYNAGIVVLSGGVAALLVPHGGLAHADALRLATFSLALAGLFAEIVAIAVVTVRDALRSREYKRLLKLSG